MPDHNLIFITGFPRSGTTFLQSLLCTQQRFISLPETHYFSLLTKGMANSQKFSIDHYHQLEKGLKEMMEMELSKESTSRLKNKIGKKELNRKNAFLSILGDYFQQKSIDTHGKTIIEKTPDHVRHMLDIKQLFPESKFICIARNPIHAINSFYEKLVAYRQPYTQLARQWQESYMKARAFKNQYPSSIEIIRYEDLVADKESVFSDLCGFLKITPDISLLENHTIEASKVILKKETWKSSNISHDIPITKDNIPVFEKLKIKWIVNREMKMLGY
jgi:hypothetical protein